MSSQAPTPSLSFLPGFPRAQSAKPHASFVRSNSSFGSIQAHPGQQMRRGESQRFRQAPSMLLVPGQAGFYPRPSFESMSFLACNSPNILNFGPTDRERAAALKKFRSSGRNSTHERPVPLPNAPPPRLVEHGEEDQAGLFSFLWSN